MPRGVPITGRQVDRALEYVAEGKTLRQIAHLLKVSVGGINNALLDEAERYAEAKQLRADLIRSERWDRAFDRKDKWSAKFLDDLALEQLPETRAARSSKVEIEHTGRIEIASHARISLEEMLAAARVEGLPGDTRGELPAAGELLAESWERVDPAGSVPAVDEP